MAPVVSGSMSLGRAGSRQQRLVRVAWGGRIAASVSEADSTWNLPGIRVGIYQLAGRVYMPPENNFSHTETVMIQ